MLLAALLCASGTVFAKELSAATLPMFLNYWDPSSGGGNVYIIDYKAKYNKVPVVDVSVDGNGDVKSITGTFNE